MKYDGKEDIRQALIMTPKGVVCINFINGSMKSAKNVSNLSLLKQIYILSLLSGPGIGLSRFDLDIKIMPDDWDILGSKSQSLAFIFAVIAWIRPNDRDFLLSASYQKLRLSMLITVPEL
ncbi:MAG: hypothetical protein AAGD96_27585 [Chloroflexota bacterium]